MKLFAPLLAASAIGAYYYYTNENNSHFTTLSSAADTKNHKVYAWGSASKGQLGMGTGANNLDIPS
jgi:alpha-tubulin suppressor-like RCC1 family protein